MNWIRVSEKLPDIKPNNYIYTFVAIKRAHNGKTYVIPASYLNQLELLSEDDDADENDMKKFSGWYQERNDCAEYDRCFEPIETEGDVVTHWMPKPPPPTE